MDYTIDLLEWLIQEGGPHTEFYKEKLAELEGLGGVEGLD